MEHREYRGLEFKGYPILMYTCVIHWKIVGLCNNQR